MPKIWIDPGHGGTDTGAIGSDGRTEKADNLRFALALRDAFTRQGCETVMTRTDNATTIYWQERTRLERDNNCDLAISCHRNFATDTAHGLEIWLHNMAPKTYIEWAMGVVSGIEALGMPIRNGQIPQRAAKGVFKGHVAGVNYNYAVNSNTNSPSMLIELGFLNASDNAWFDRYYKEAAEAVVKASMVYLGGVYVPPDSLAPVAPGASQKEWDAQAAKLATATQERDQALKRANKAETAIAAIRAAIDKYSA